jgi:hypothetical protein
MKLALPKPLANELDALMRCGRGALNMMIVKEGGNRMERASCKPDVSDEGTLSVGVVCRG